MMLTNQVWMLQWIFLWIFKFISIDNLHCEPSIFIVSYGTKISHLTLCKERISIARSCIKNKWEKQFSSCSQENSLIADNPLGRGHRHSIYWNYFRDLAPVRDSWAPLSWARDGQWSLWHTGDPRGAGDHPVPMPTVTALSSVLPSLHSNTDFSSQESPPISPQDRHRSHQRQPNEFWVWVQGAGRATEKWEMFSGCTECISRHTDPAARFLWQFLWEQKLLFVNRSQRLGVIVT